LVTQRARSAQALAVDESAVRAADVLDGHFASSSADPCMPARHAARGDRPLAFGRAPDDDVDRRLFELAQPLGRPALDLEVGIRSHGLQQYASTTVTLSGAPLCL